MAAIEPPLIDPRRGDVEDDVSSPKQRSLLAIAGSLLAEISLPKLLFAFIFSIVLPGLLARPGAAGRQRLATETIDHRRANDRARCGVRADGRHRGRLVRMATAAAIAERNFWSLNALAIQPAYTFSREGIRYLAEGMLRTDASDATRARWRAISSAAVAIVLASSRLRSPPPHGRPRAGSARPPTCWMSAA